MIEQQVVSGEVPQKSDNSLPVVARFRLLYVCVKRCGFDEAGPLEL